MTLAGALAEPASKRPRRGEAEAAAADEDDDDAWPPPDEGAARDARTDGPARLNHEPPGDIDVNASGHRMAVSG